MIVYSGDTYRRSFVELLLNVSRFDGDDLRAELVVIWQPPRFDVRRGALRLQRAPVTYTADNVNNCT